MATPKPLREAAFLQWLAHGPYDAIPAGIPATPALVLESKASLTEAGQWLMQLLTARQAVEQAAFDTEVAADELRRYQKFSKPGQPSAHIVQMRQKQASARQASARAKQAFLKSAMEFVRLAALEIPPRVTLEAFVLRWIEVNLPKNP